MDRFETTFRVEQGRLLNYLARRVGRDAAPDLVQEIFVRMANRPEVHNLDNPTAYAWRVARNLLIEQARRNKRRNAIFYPLDEQRDPGSVPEQTWGIEADDLLRLLNETIDRMPEKTRRVFIMKRIEERTQRESGEQLGISVAAVEYHMGRAIALCRRRLTRC
jgi:RNA polymerase sigma-70 factor (ECF subfamily)